MNRRLAASVSLFLLALSVGAFAAERRNSRASYLASFNGPGAITLSATGGGGLFGWGLNAGAEYAVGRFEVGPVPLSWGIEAQASLGFDKGGVGITAGGLPTLNFGLDFGRNLRFEGAFGLGPGLVLEAWSGGGNGIGIAQHAGATWWFSDALGLTLEECVMHAFGLVDWYYAGIGAIVRI